MKCPLARSLPYRLWVAKVFGLGLIWVGNAAAQQSSSPKLRLDDVMASVRRMHPMVERMRQEVAEARGAEMSAKGAFDPELQARGVWNALGFYENLQLDTTLSQRVPLWGLEIYGGYRYGNGDFAVYKGDEETNNDGELRAGARLPLWRNGPIDAFRAERTRTRLLRQRQEQLMSSGLLTLARSAARSYWAWLAAGLELDVQRRLLEISERRQERLERQATQGVIAEIVQVDNMRAVLERRARVYEAERKFQGATFALSLFLRDNAMRPLRADFQALPSTFPRRSVAFAELGTLLKLAYTQRPELKAIARRAEAAEVNVRLARNQRGPDIGVGVEVSKDIGEGKDDLDPTQLSAGATLAMPLPLRKERGKLRQAEAKQGVVEAERRGLRDRIGAQVRDARAGLHFATKRLAVAEAQVDLAQRLAQAERRKFESGASTLVIVNLREIAEADARSLHVKAMADYHTAESDLRTAIGLMPLR